MAGYRYSTCMASWVRTLTVAAQEELRPWSHASPAGCKQFYSFSSSVSFITRAGGLAALVPRGMAGPRGRPGRGAPKRGDPRRGRGSLKKTTGPLFESPRPPFSPQHRTRTDAFTAVIGLLRRFAANSALKTVSDIYIFTKECIHLHYATFSKIPILTNIRAGPDGPGSLGWRGADFARGRGARGAGRRPPATLPTLVRRGARCAGSRRARDHIS